MPQGAKPRLGQAERRKLAISGHRRRNQDAPTARAALQWHLQALAAGVHWWYASTVAPAAQHHGSDGRGSPSKRLRNTAGACPVRVALIADVLGRGYPFWKTLPRDSCAMMGKAFFRNQEPLPPHL